MTKHYSNAEDDYDDYDESNGNSGGAAGCAFVAALIAMCLFVAWWLLTQTGGGAW